MNSNWSSVAVDTSTPSLDIFIPKSLPTPQPSFW
ncbi:hypothetical protein [Caudoviricetes sp.]|nr:hypothetical protein [Caudoviricetes sp.]